MLANRPVAWLHAEHRTPSTVGHAELRALIGDYVLRRRSGSFPPTLEQGDDGLSRGLLPKQLPGYDRARVMVEHDAEPKAERPDLRQGGQTCGKENGSHGTQKATRRQDRQVDMPHVIGCLRRDGAARARASPWVAPCASWPP